MEGRNYGVTVTERREGRLFRDMNLPQGLWLAGWSVPALFGLIVRQSLLEFVLFLGVGLVGAYRYTWGPGIYYPLDWLQGARIKFHRGAVYLGETATAKRGSKNGQVVIPLTPVDFLGRFGAIYDPRSNMDTFYVGLGPWDHVNDDLELRAARDRRLGEALKSVIAEVSTNIGISPISMARPMRADKLVRAAWPVLHPRVSDRADQSPLALRSKQAWEQLVSQAVQYGREHRGLYAVSVARPPSWDKFRKNPHLFTEEDLDGSPVYSVLQSIVEYLRVNEFNDVEVLSYDELCLFVYRGWNVVPDSKPEAWKDTPWPTKQITVDYPKRLIQLGGSYHRVLVVNRRMYTTVLPGGYGSLRAGHGPWVTMSVTTRTTERRLEYALLKAGRNFLAAFVSIRASGAIVRSDAETRDAEEAAARRVDQLYRAGTKPTRTNIVFVVSSPSPEGVEKTQRQLESRLRQQGMSVIVPSGRGRLLRIFFAGVYGLSF